MNSRNLFCIFNTALAALFSVAVFAADDPMPLPCDYYGDIGAQSPTGKTTVTAKDSANAVLASASLSSAATFGYLRIPAEKAAALTRVAFSIDGTAQSKTASWISGGTVLLGLGLDAAADTSTFDFHLSSTPYHATAKARPEMSGLAVADMILDQIDPANTDTQEDLYSFVSASRTAAGEAAIFPYVDTQIMQTLLNAKAPKAYHFGTTIDVEQISQQGIIAPFSATDPSDCLKQIAHWMTYRVKDADKDKAYVPVAVATSADPAKQADADYKTWMSIVGVKTNVDPFPAITAESSARAYYRTPQELSVLGVYINDPSTGGLGAHGYISAEAWQKDYFKPIGVGLPFAGKYIAVMEPPRDDAQTEPVNLAETAQDAVAREIVLRATPSLSIPKPSDTANTDITSLLARLRASDQYVGLDKDPYFSRSMTDASVSRIFKVARDNGEDYTIIPFDKTNAGNEVSTAAYIIDNATGSLSMAFADPTSSQRFGPTVLTTSYASFRAANGWTGRPCLGYWLSRVKGSPLAPDWTIISARTESVGSLTVVYPERYVITAAGMQKTENPIMVSVLSATSWTTTNGESVRRVSFNVTAAGAITVTHGSSTETDATYITQNGNTFDVYVSESIDAEHPIIVTAKTDTAEYSAYIVEVTE